MAKEEPKVVIQQDVTGCGIACAAMLAGTTYHEAKKRAKNLGIFPDDRTLNSDICDLRPLLNSYNIKIGRKVPFTGWKHLPSSAILAVNYKNNGEIDEHSWHWALFQRKEDRGIVLDPRKKLKNNIRTDLGNVKPKWYIPVERSG